MSEQHPLRRISSDAIPWKAHSEGTRYGGRYRHLTRAVMGKEYRVGVAIEELDPGKTSNPAHFHIFEEEHVFVLEGTLGVRLGDTIHPMKAGDYVCFPAGQKLGHCLVNDSHTTCRYIMVGENNPNEICVYPDSNKVLVRALGRRAMLDLSATRNYWDGEDTGVDQSGRPPPGDVVAIADTGAPKLPVSSQSLEWNVEGEGPRFGGRSRHLTCAAVGADYHVGMLIESPSPGMRLCPKHYHMQEEEHALILEGEVTLLWGDERHALQVGDYVCFPAGLRTGHSFLNSGSGPCSYLMIGERNAGDVCVYPDSNKMSVRALRTEKDIFDMSATRRYLDGEDD